MGRREFQKYFPHKFPYRGNGNENLLHARPWVRRTRHHARWTSKREQRNTAAWQTHWLKNPFAQAWESLLSPGAALAWPEENIKDTPDFKSLPRVWSAGQEMGKSSWKEFGSEGAYSRTPLVPHGSAHHVYGQHTWYGEQLGTPSVASLALAPHQDTAGNKATEEKIIQ